MEGASHIIERLASRDSTPTFKDAQGVTVTSAPTLDVDSAVRGPDDSKAPHAIGSQSSGPHKAAAGSQPTLASRLVGKVEGIAHAITGAVNKAAGPNPPVTSVHGCPVGDNTHSFNINGYPLASDVFMFEQQQLFNRAKIVERAVHACGSGAFGYFEVTNPRIAELTKAAFLQPGVKTPIFARFSTVTYGREFPDSARNPRGMAVKFYTEEGNYDVLMVNFPAFFNRDPIMGPSVIRSQQRSPENFQVNFDATLDFMSLVPESCLANLWFWSDHGTPRGWQHMDGFPCHTFKWVNREGRATWVRYVFKCEQGLENFDFDTAVRVCGEDPDFAKRDLWETIHSGKSAAWRFCVQTMTEEQAEAAPFNPFDVTKEWPQTAYPPIEVGRLVVDRNPENYHRDVEQAAFSPGRLVPGIELSPDPLLQFRATFYNDAQLYRLGTNYHQIPVNCPFRSKSYHPLARDGITRIDNNGGVEPHYYPNSGVVPPPARPDLTANWAPTKVQGVLGRFVAPRSAEGTDAEYVQARAFYGSMTDEQRRHTHYNLARAFKQVSRWEVKLRFLMQAYAVDPRYAAGVLSECDKLGASDPNVTLDRVKKNIEKHPHTVDAAHGYIPFPLE